MPAPSPLETAARLGLLGAEPDTAAAGDEALHLLRALVPSDACTLLAFDPFTAQHRQLAGIACSEHTARSLAVEFVETPWYRRVLSEPLPPSISDESGQPYRHGSFYEQYVRPEGFRDGMSGALRCQGRYVGMIHLTSQRPDAFGIEARRTLASLIPALSRVADPVARLAGAAVHDGAGYAAALVQQGQVIDLPGRARPAPLAHDAFKALVEAFEQAPGRRVRFLWPSGAQWFRIVLTRRQPTPDHPARPVLVRAAPIEAPFRLSPRELDVLTRAATGQTNAAIAQQLFLSPRTVHTHIEHILRKTGAKTRGEAISLAVRDGLLYPAGPGIVARFAERY